MEVIDAILIGIVQGLTEFLPVSSSGHIEIAKALLGDDAVPAEGMLFTVVLHAATALSTVVIFRKDILAIIKGLFQAKFNEHWKFVIAIGISMVPAGLVGILFEEELEAFFYKNILLVGLCLLVTGVLLFLADKAKKTNKDVTWFTAAVIGVAQAIAILPGISRSGATIGTSVLLGIDRSKAARFSFLMVIPLIFGAMLLKVKKYAEVTALEELSVDDRVEVILQKSKDDVLINDAIQMKIEPLLKVREIGWDNLASSGKASSKSIAEVGNNFSLAISNTDLTKEQFEYFTADSFSGFRPVAKTSTTSLSLGFVAAFLTGLLACTWMIKLVKKSQLKYFAFYCMVVGAISIIYAAI